MVYQVQQLLEQGGIPCYIKNEFASGAIGELAPMDVQPEVWLTDDEWESRAQHLINEFQTANEDKSGHSGWHCHQCQEFNAANFEICWQCGEDSRRSNAS